MGFLKLKILKELFWSLGDSFGTYILRFGFSLLIARQLSPHDYGLMGMIIIFLTIGNILFEGGFGMGLIQKGKPTEIDFSSVFYFNVFVSIIIYVILYFSSNIIAEFFNEPILIDIIRISSITIILAAFTSIQIVILNIELDFKIQAIINAIATLISGIIGVFMAYNNYEVWSLVFQLLILYVVKLAGFWIVSKWRPTFIFEKQSLIKLSKFSNKIFIQGITGVLFTKLYFPLIGKFFSVSELGFYTTASNFSEIIVKQFTNAYNKVFFPVLSSVKNSTSFKSKYISIYSILSIILVFISALAIIITPAFIEIVIGKKWLPSVIFMQLFLVEGLFYGLLMLNETIFNAKGDSGYSLRIDIIKKTLLMLSLFISYRYGIVWIIIGQVFSTFTTFIYSIFLVEKKYSIITKNLNMEYLKILFVATIIFSIDHFILQKYFNNIIYLFLGEILILPITFILLIFILKIKGLKYIVTISKKYLPLFIVNQFK
tara:strand:- start:21187 stop:22647 length:1461 start_codon:yes stop_codon:yes gene_type:complete